MYRYNEGVGRRYNFTKKDEKSEMDFQYNLEIKEEKGMAINLYTLHAKELVSLTRTSTQSASYRLNTDKITENWEQIKSDSRNMIQISQESAAYYGNISVDEMKNAGEVRRMECNYSLDAFFRKDMPQVTTDGGYMVGGVYFSKEELEQCRMVLKTASDNMGCGIGKNTNLDYRNYAQMGIAVGMVKRFANGNLTEKQAGVVNKAMQEYNEALIDMERELMSDGSYVDSKYSGISDYYGKAKILSDGEIEAINNLKKELSKITGRYYEPSKSGMISGVQSATNQELIHSIVDLFSDLDYTDKKSVDLAMEKYKEWMKPAYTAYGMRDSHGSLSRVLNEDVAGFRRQIANVLRASEYHMTDYSI